MKLKHITIGFVLILSIFLTGCNSKQEEPTAEKMNTENDVKEVKTLKIYTSLFTFEDFTKKIGGELVDVQTLIPPGADSHTYEPTSKEMVNIAKADAFIYSGLGMESYAEKISTSLEKENTLMVEAALGIETAEHDHDHGDENTHESEEHHEGEKHAHENEDHHEGEKHDHESEEHHKGEKHDHESEDHHEGEKHDHESEQHHEGEKHDHESEQHHEGEENAHEDDHHDHGDIDPHVWLDPYLAISLAENIKNALVTLMPEASDVFNANFETLKADLENLDKEFHDLIASKQNPEMIVSHAAYGYWEKSYGIQQIPVSGLSPTNEPSQKQLEKIIDIAKEKQIKYVIFEQNITPKIAEVIRTEIKAEPLRLHNLSVLTEEDIQNGEDYFSLMRENLETLDLALQ